MKERIACPACKRKHPWYGCEACRPSPNPDGALARLQADLARLARIACYTARAAAGVDLFVDGKEADLS